MIEFDFQPTLEGNLIALKPLQQSDFNALFAAASDPLIWEQHPVKDRYKKPVFEKFFRESVKSGGALVIIDNSNNEIIGSSRYHGYNKAKSEIEIGWTFLTRKYWGGKYNKELKNLMLKHAFNYVENVILLSGVKNRRSQKSVEKIGGVKMGIRQDAFGNESVTYKITRPYFSELINRSKLKE